MRRISWQITWSITKNTITIKVKNVIKLLAKSVLIPLGLTVAASAVDAEIHKKILGSGNVTTLIISNDEIEDIIKIVKSLEDSGLLLKEVHETVQNDVKEHFMKQNYKRRINKNLEQKK